MVRPGREKLTGNVEVDETYVGGDKIGKRGRGADGKALVMVAVEFTDTIKNKKYKAPRFENHTSLQLHLGHETPEGHLIC